MCDALFEKGAMEFLLKLGTNVNFAVCQKACFAIGSDIIFSDTKSALQQDTYHWALLRNSMELNQEATI